MPRSKPRNPYGKHESGRQNLGTPLWFIDALFDVGYSIELDVCADPDTAVCPRYLTVKDDGLRLRWEVDREAWAWCNPPLGQAAKWIAKVSHEAYERNIKTLMLLPFQPGTKWFQHGMVYVTQIHLITPRLNYWDPETGELTANASFNSCLWEITPDFDAGYAYQDGELRIRYWHLPKPKGATR